MPNIKYSSEQVASKVTELQQKVQQLLRDDTAEYDNITGLLSVSQGESIEAIKVQCVAEKAAMHAFADFYDKLLTMIKNASKDVDQTEVHYQEGHLSGGGHAR